MRVWKAISEYFRKVRAKRNPNGEIKLDEVGFELILHEQLASRVDWHDVAEIWAYKRDMNTVDQICMDIRSGESWSFVTEDDVGWNDLVAEIERRFIDPAWRGVVVPGPFETNLTQLYARQEPTLAPE